MGKRNRNKSDKKRKHSSDNSTSGQLKNPRNGNSPKNDLISTEVSDSIHKANSVLYNDDDNDGSFSDLNISVFDSKDSEKSSVSSDNKKSTDNMAEKMEEGVKSSEQECSNDVMAYLKKIDSKISQMDKRLDKLDSLEVKVTKFESEMSKLWNFVSDNLKSVNEKVLDTVNRVEHVEFQLGRAADDIARMQRDRSKIMDDLVYVQSQSMRNNLVFGGIDESAHETNEQTEQKLRLFMEDKLHLANDLVKQISFERVHRMGAHSTRSARKIVAKFTFFKDRETVRKQRKELENTSYFLHEQFPREIVERRKALVPRLKAAKREGRNAWISYDTLYIDGFARIVTL